MGSNEDIDGTGGRKVYRAVDFSLRGAASLDR
jgi:hypothetical protein